MSNISETLATRADHKCELCGGTNELSAYTVPPKSGDSVDEQVAVCNICLTQMEGEELDSNHWRCLNESMWSEVPAVQVVAHRMLTKLSGEDWAADLLNMLYLSDETAAWAQQGTDGDVGIVHTDSNGNILAAGDSVVLIQDLKVKGANFTAKRGTAVRRIRLDPDNAEHIEGKVDGQQIVILTKFVKKTN